MPFVSFRDVPPRSRTRDNVIGIYNLHLPAIFFMHVLPCICNNSITACHIDIIGMIVAISPLERTRNRGITKREIVLYDREYVSHELILKGTY